MLNMIPNKYYILKIKIYKKFYNKTKINNKNTIEIEIKFTIMKMSYATPINNKILIFNKFYSMN